MKVAIDSSVLVGLINPRDLWRDKAIALRRALLDHKAELYYFDCVVAESISDALIALTCREREIPAIASFDADFDQVTWLRRLVRPEDVAS